MLPLSIINRLPSSLHLLHHHVLLLQGDLLALHCRLMVLQHGIALLRQRYSHSLDRPLQVLSVTLRGLRRSYTMGCHNTGHTERTIRKWVRLETHLNTTRKGTTKAKQTHSPQTLRNEGSDTIKM